MGREAMRRERTGRGESQEKAGGDLPDAAGHDKPNNVAGAGAERHADADLPRAAGGGVGDDGVDADGRHDERDKSEAKEELAEEAQEPDLMLNGLVEAVDVGQRQVLIEAWTAVRTAGRVVVESTMMAMLSQPAWR